MTHMLALKSRVSEAMLIWLSCLDEAGIDLKHYGRRETMALSNNSETGLESNCYWIHQFMLPDCINTFWTLKIIGFDFSHRPGLWKAHFAWRLDPMSVWECLAGDFWSLVETSAKPCQVKAIPGSWDSEWDCEETSVIYTPGYSRRQPRGRNREWREKAAKEAATNEAIQVGMSTTPNWLIQQHRKRLRRGAVRGRYGGSWCKTEWWCEEDREWHCDDSWKVDCYANYGAKELDGYKYFSCYID